MSNSDHSRSSLSLPPPHNTINNAITNNPGGSGSINNNGAAVPSAYSLHIRPPTPIDGKGCTYLHIIT
jgi:hypothetical protein